MKSRVKTGRREEEGEMENIRTAICNQVSLWEGIKVLEEKGRKGGRSCLFRLKPN